ncbi:hypothetical protein AVEN_167589-1 [Araneus ventricosus]|uniref:Retrovirus-related Pol polyprotein from transposon TNT 1-94 n=1 Tax=Araneus ventricosus TaxID=182803 RepID=A0A4Y2HTK8_ARAVE|nr:hypothetical protein AVEN_167589-1 [Araneus ventricosus]
MRTGHMDLAAVLQVSIMASTENWNFDKLNNDNYKEWMFNIMELLNLGLIDFVGKKDPVLDGEATKLNNRSSK